jgi:hypothetical protein
MTEFYKQSATAGTKRRVRRARPIHDVAASGIVARLIAQNTVEDKNLLTKIVFVGSKLSTGAVPLVDPTSQTTHESMAVSGQRGHNHD